MCHWEFTKKRRYQKGREPMQESFFTNSSISDSSHALIREAFQNSLDARIKDSSAPVHIEIGLFDLTFPEIQSFISDKDWKHFESALPDIVLKPFSLKFLTLEDFNTTGLEGDYYVSNSSEADQNPFYYFLRSEGQSGKLTGNRGRHGIGKYVFPYLSALKTFFYLTVRNSDKKILAGGQCILKEHEVDNTPYTPDGWWGKFEDDGFQLPIEDNPKINHLLKTFKLKRSLNQNGLSIIVPYVPEEINSTILLENILTEFYFPIIDKQLTVKLTEDGTRHCINAENLKQLYDQLNLKNDKKHLLDQIQLGIAAQNIRKIGNMYQIETTTFSKAPKWNSNMISEKTSEAIRNELENTGSTVGIEVRLPVREKKEKTTSKSSFQMFLQKLPEDGKNKPVFIREGIKIIEDKVSKIGGYNCLALIDNGPLANMLGDAENPAHTEWERNGPKFRGKYEWGSSTISFVRKSFSKLLDLIAKGDEREDKYLLSDIFYLNKKAEEDKEKTARGRKKQPEENENGDETEDTGKPDLPTRKKPYSLYKIDGGFSISGNNESDSQKRHYNVRIAYDIVGAKKNKALNKYHRNDFDLNKMKEENSIRFENLSHFLIEKNNISFIAKDSDFKLTVSNFDKNRDLIVDVKHQKEEVNEEV